MKRSVKEELGGIKGGVPNARYFNLLRLRSHQYPIQQVYKVLGAAFWGITS
jgi:hypothetical protein